MEFVHLCYGPWKEKIPQALDTCFLPLTWKWASRMHDILPWKSFVVLGKIENWKYKNWLLEYIIYSSHEIVLWCQEQQRTENTKTLLVCVKKTRGLSNAWYTPPMKGFCGARKNRELTIQKWASRMHDILLPWKSFVVPGTTENWKYKHSSRMCKKDG